MGEAKMLTTSSETSSEKRRLYFEPVVSRESSLKRHSTLGEGSISLLLLWWVVERARSYFSPAGRLFEPKKFTERVLRTIVFCHGRAENVDNFIWDFVRKETALFRDSTISWYLFRTSFDPWWRLHFTKGVTMSRWTAEILFFAGRSTFRAERVLRTKCASHLGRSMERHRRVVRSTLRWTFSKFSSAAFHAEKILGSPSGGLRRPQEPPGGFLRLFLEKLKILNFHHFSWSSTWNIFLSWAGRKC